MNLYLKPNYCQILIFLHFPNQDSDFSCHAVPILVYINGSFRTSQHNVVVRLPSHQRVLYLLDTSLTGEDHSILVKFGSSKVPRTEFCVGKQIYFVYMGISRCGNIYYIDDDIFTNPCIRFYQFDGVII